MKTYTLVLDVVIMLLLALTIHFNISNDIIINSFARRNGMVRTMIISWQTLFFFASFCVLLRFIAKKLAE